AEQAMFTKEDFLENERIVVQKAWMDTKRKNNRPQIADAVARIVSQVEAFKPDIILLGDDNAANYIGNQYIDTGIPVVFWGINGLPVRYGLIDSLDRPGHNVTGIYQAGYLKENIVFLKKIVPSIRTIAILSDDSPTGRSKVKALEQLAQQGELPVKIIGSVVTNGYEEWKLQAQRLSKKVDAFFVLNHNTLKDVHGKVVDQLEAGRWYLTNILKPDCAHEKQFAQEGILLVVDDSGFKQGYEAMQIALSIVLGGRDPADIPVRAPTRGPVIVNRQRAEMLGIDISAIDFVEETIAEALALKP
ncbi:MAG: hypothetical protein K8I00_11230, partial [Candidatus Omnitrophica bacterium]|nr:hypothetical protein [Candidatus Omnitrophota bacterium]